MDRPIVDKTIGNPLSWAARQTWQGTRHAADATRELGGIDGARAVPEHEIATLTYADLGAAMRAGLDDLAATRSDALTLCLVYPVIGLALVGFAMSQSLLPLVFPLLSGFALIGPLAALGLYQMSREREAGGRPGWSSALAVATSPAFPALVVLGLYLIAVLMVWLVAAHAIYAATLGPQPPAGAMAFLAATFGTAAGWVMIAAGVAVGFGFALLVLATSVVSFPLLLDRHVGLPNAVVTSLRVTRKNPRVILAWGGIVAAGLLLGALPALAGLVIVLPVLGHATWHLYRRAIPRS